MTRWLALVASLLMLGCGFARAQDFASAAPSGPWSSPASLLEQALPTEAVPALLEAGWTSWLGVPELSTRSVAVSAALGVSRFSAGVSATGSGVGWQSAGVGIGAAGAWGGVGLRVLGRRDAYRSEPASRGAELGAGAWAGASRNVRVWARAPQLWVDGEAPALARPLALGIDYDLDDVRFWLERESPAQPGKDPGVHSLGLCVALAGATAWVEGRERPFRGAVGIAADLGRVTVSARVEAHPLLGDTVSLGLGWRSGRTP